MIDFDKPLKTKAGHKARLLCNDFMQRDEGESAVVVVRDLLDKFDNIRIYDLSGKSVSFNSDMDLINVPETRVVWVNIYPPSFAAGYSTRDIAERAAAENRVACIRVEYTVGQFDEEPQA